MTLRKVAGPLLIVALAACTDPPAKPPTPTASATPAAVETRTVDAAGDLLTMTMLPLGRTPAGTVTVTIRTTLDRPSTAGRSTNISAHFSAATTGSADGIRLVDLERRRVHLPAPAADGGRCACTGRLRLAQGETGDLQAGFQGLPADATHLSVMLPYAGVFANVPIVDRGDPGNDPGNDPTLPPSHAGDLGAYTERLDVPLRSRITKDGVELQLGTDVLFDVDNATLTPAATRVIDAAADELRATAPGPLTITGHTDSTADARHNQELSERRAAAVAGALNDRLPAARWPVTTGGKGETQPAFPNDTADHRRLNRRVTIAYRGTADQAQDAPLPSTEGKQAAGSDGVETTLPLSRGTVRFRAAEARRLGPFVTVDLTATNTGTDDATILDYLGQSVFTVRDELDPYAPYGAGGVRMLAGNTAVYNLDYRNENDRYRCLCDRLLNRALPPASTRTISLWFPAPADGITTIALDVPDRLRLTGIPLR